MHTYIIEHLEQKLWPWCVIEYKHISETVGKRNLWFTKVSSPKLKPYGKVYSQSVADLYPKLKNVCVLDPVAKKTLTFEESQKFDYFIFGGILGDDPPQQRTEPELTSRLPGVVARNIGRKQMSTDTAVYVVQQITLGKKLSELKFQDGLEIPLGKHESTVLPYRYVVVDEKPRVSPELVRFLQKRAGL